MEQTKRGTSQDSTTESAGPISPLVRTNNSNKLKLRPREEFYQQKSKTELCKNFMMAGTCRFGEGCSFAHGTQQMKAKVHLHPRYKTKPCHNFFFDGYCSYGTRCQYQHNEIKWQKGYEHFLSSLYAYKSIPKANLAKYKRLPALKALTKGNKARSGQTPYDCPPLDLYSTNLTSQIFSTLSTKSLVDTALFSH